MIGSAPKCIISAPSPSRQTTFLEVNFANPKAICEQCPILPTVKKSLLCGKLYFLRISKSSRDAFPVVETIKESLQAKAIFSLPFHEATYNHTQRLL